MSDVESDTIWIRKSDGTKVIVVATGGTWVRLRRYDGDSEWWATLTGFWKEYQPVK